MPVLRRPWLRSLVSELKRRRVFRTTGVYIVAVFAALQGADVLVPALHLPEWTMTLLVVLAITGFPLAIGLAWAFDIGPGGVKRTGAAGTATELGTTGPEASAGLPGDDPDRESRVAAAAGSSAASAAAPAGATAEPADPLGRGATGTNAARVGPPEPPPAGSPPFVAVLPFLNLSPDPENEYFADGITEDVIAQLSKIRALKVISRTSVMAFKTREQSPHEIGARLGATTLLEGSVRRAGDRVRIVAQLIDTRTDQHIWAETYDRRLTDIFSIQTDVAFQIAAALQAELSPDEASRIRKEPTDNLAAYQLYLKGRQWFIRYTPEGVQRAIEFYRRAVNLDPGYALPHAGIAMAYADLAETGALPPDVARREAMGEAERALALDPGLGEAHCTVAHLKAIWELDWKGADKGFRRAIELCPNSADAFDFYGRLRSAQGRFDEALAMQRRAQELDPLAHRLDVASTLLRAGRYAEAEVEARQAIDFDPEHNRARATLGWALLEQGRTKEGLAEIERAVALTPENTQWLAQLGQARAMTGDEAGAREILARLEARAAAGEYISPYHLAFIYTGLGEHDRAIDLLERSLEERAGAIYGVKGSFLFAPLRPHPRFKALTERMGLG